MVAAVVSVVEQDAHWLANNAEDDPKDDVACMAALAEIALCSL